MFRRSIKRLSSRPGFTTGAVLIVIIAAAGIALLFAKEQPKGDADVAIEPRAARIERVEGNVLIGEVAEDQEPNWAEATINAPVAVGDRIYARDDSQASIALTGRNYVELKPGGSLDVLSMTDQETQLALRSGSALFNIGELGEDELFEVATPYGAVDFVEPGLYQVGLDGDNAVVSVLRGRAQVVGEGGTEYITQGQVFTLVGANGTQALAETLEPQLAGGIVDDYYRDRYPETYDGRYASYDTYLEDPSYYDSYSGSQSYDYVRGDIAGVRDLDYYGDWTDVDGYGQGWAPRVSAGWAPFRHGYWHADPFFGPTWVSYEPWGWAPYHYGRWAFVNQRWFWIPVGVVRQPVYYPATVAFISFTHTNHIGWVPLAPGEIFVPRYYDTHFQPHYLASHRGFTEVAIQHTFVNLHAPSGVTVVPVAALSRAIDPRVITHVDSSVIARHRATLNPFAIDGFRQLALRKKDARHHIKLARIEREALNRQVVTSRTPAFLSQRAGVARGLRAERVSEARRKNKLRVERTGQVVNTRRRDGLPQSSFNANAREREQRKSALAARANQGDKSARRELRRVLRQEQRAGGKQTGGKQPVISPPSVQRQAERQQLRRQVKKQLRLQQRQKKPVDRQRSVRQAQQQRVRPQQKQQQRINRQQRSTTVQRQQRPQRVRPQQRQQQRINRQQQNRTVQRQQRPQQVRPQQRQQRPQRVRPQPRPPKRKPSGIATRQQTQPSQALRQSQIRQPREQVRIQRPQQRAARQAQMMQQRQQSRARVERQQRAITNQQNRTSATQAARQSQIRKPSGVQRQVQQNRQQTVNRQGKVRPRKNQ